MTPPASHETLLETALARHRAGDTKEADKLYEKLLRREPKNATAWYLRSVIAMSGGKYQAASSLLEKAVRFAPENPVFLCNLGEAYRRLSRLPEAAQALERALGLKPDLAEAHFNLGLVAEAQGDAGRALACYEAALALRPDLPGGAARLVRALHAAQAHERALSVYARLSRLTPSSVELERAVASVLADVFRFDEALVHIERTLELEPDSASALAHQASVLADLGHIDQAIGLFRRVLELEPQLHPAKSSLIYYLTLSPDAGATDIRREAESFDRIYAAELPRAKQHANSRDPGRRLRVGYVSPDFRHHACSHFLLPLFDAHDRKALEVFAYSNVSHPDSVTQMTQKLVDQWRDISALDDEAAADLIRKDGIDVLVDLALHTAHNRLLLFARKPAPVQVTWLAYPGTSGLSAMDYRLTDVHLDPPDTSDEDYSERSLSLPETFWSYDPFADAPVNELPALSSGSVTFASLNNFRKVTPAAISLWAGVLRAIPSSRMLLVAPIGAARERLKSAFEAEQVDFSRIELVSQRPREDFSRLHHRIDCCLDTVPYNGGTTSLDAYFMGVPVLTLRGRTAVGRSGTSLAHNLGLPELVAATPEEFVERAVALTGDLGRLAELRRTLRARLEASPLMDVKRFARNLEAAYREMWTRFCGATRTI